MYYMFSANCPKCYKNKIKKSIPWMSLNLVFEENCAVVRSLV